MDTELRKLERVPREDHPGQARLLALRLRLGEVFEEQVTLWAHLGDPGSRLLIDLEPVEPESWIEGLTWIARSGSWASFVDEELEIVTGQELVIAMVLAGAEWIVAVKLPHHARRHNLKRECAIVRRWLEGGAEYWETNVQARTDAGENLLNACRNWNGVVASGLKKTAGALITDHGTPVHEVMIQAGLELTGRHG